MKSVLLLFAGIALFSCKSVEASPNPCIMVEEFIKQDLSNPNTLEHSVFDCNKESTGYNTWTVLTKISAKNAFGVSQEYIYKVVMKYKGGIDVDIKNWELISMRSEQL